MLRMERLHYLMHSARKEYFLSQVPEVIIGHSNDPNHEDLQAGTYQDREKIPSVVLGLGCRWRSPTKSVDLVDKCHYQ